MTHAFDEQYWETHWTSLSGASPAEHGGGTANPHVVDEIGALVPGTALDAGCGHGAEAIWLAARGWRVTAADVSGHALEQAAARAAGLALPRPVTWLQADLTAWEPEGRFDLVMTNYAHASMPQLDLYEQLSRWVAPGGTLLVVGHLEAPAAAGAPTGLPHAHPPAASVRPEDVAARLGRDGWRVETADRRARTVMRRPGHAMTLHDAVIRATRREG
ncbi:class I SAM-dependent methyltransferase [Sinomonas mesophila]|uniref:class I SAM-dependent methyltransferase n=1 Tax=Sinomonas mesophila TaxID=1531955 RepID=UPI000985CA23|nr:class I SAM-dependent methyltransferase [Sinomonas mesophila]